MRKKSSDGMFHYDVMATNAASYWWNPR